MTVRGKKRTANRSPIAKAKYVVETHCDNGNVFLHGPFNSRTKADEYVETREEDDWNRSVALGYNPLPSTHKIRAILHPDKWTKMGK